MPIAEHAEALKLLRLHTDPLFGKGAALGAELIGRHLILILALIAILFFNLPFNRQAVAIPARHINRIASHHLMGADNHVFQNFIERMADMNIAIGIGRAVMQHEFLTAFGISAQLIIQADFRPMGEHIGLTLGQTGFHRKFGLRQVQRFAPVALICVFTHCQFLFEAL